MTILIQPLDHSGQPVGSPDSRSKPMANPNRVLANSRRALAKLETLRAYSAAEAEQIAASKRGPGVRVRVSRFRIGSRSERLYSWQVHVYAKA